MVSIVQPPLTSINVTTAPKIVNDPTSSLSRDNLKYTRLDTGSDQRQWSEARRVRADWRNSPAPFDNSTAGDIAQVFFGYFMSRLSTNDFNIHFPGTSVCQ